MLDFFLNYILPALAMVVGAVPAGLFLVYAYYRIKARGYTPPVTSLLMIGGWITGLLLLVPFGERLLDGSPALFVIAIAVIPSLLPCGIAAVLPQRKQRSFGERRVKLPLRTLAYACFTAAIAVTALEVVILVLDPDLPTITDKKALSRLPELIGIFVTSGLFFRYLDSLRREKTIEQVLSGDLRPPVLYLRAFNQERDYFAVLPAEEYASRVMNPFTRRAVNTKQVQEIALTMEQYLKPEIEKGIGPLVALGSPEDYLPPEGAARTYADDVDWMERFKALAAEAQAIVMEVSRSENLRFELQWLRTLGLQTKLFILTRPRRPRALAWLTRLNYVWVPRLRGIPPSNWTEFSTDLKQLGYGFDFDAPGPGAVISFDADGRAAALTSGAQTPSEFFVPIRDWLSSGGSGPQCARIQCESCGKVVLFKSVALGAEAICADCRYFTEYHNRSPRERWQSFWLDSGLWGGWFVLAGMAVFFGLIPSMPDQFRESDYALLVLLAIALVAGLMPVWLAYLLPSRRKSSVIKS